MRHSRSLSRAIASLPLGVLVSATTGRLVAPPRFPPATPSAHPSARVRAGEAAGVAAFADRHKAAALGTAEKSECDVDHARRRYQSPMLDRDAFVAVREGVTSVLPVALLTTRGAHVPYTSALWFVAAGKDDDDEEWSDRGGLVRFARLYAIVDTIGRKRSDDFRK
jgi:hypothetical protein